MTLWPGGFMTKFKRLKLPVFRIEESDLSSYKITFCNSAGVGIDSVVLPDSYFDACLAKAICIGEVRCTVEDEHQNTIRFRYTNSAPGKNGFMKYLREILDENQYVIPKNMSVVDSVGVDSAGGIIISLALDINPLINDISGGF
jgi:hypothetical protein